jgi:hypothetical protein
MRPMLSILYEGKEIHFYADGSSSNVPEGMQVANYIPLIIRRFQAIIREIANDYLPVIKGVTGSSGGSQGVEEYSDSNLVQKGTISGEK